MGCDEDSMINLKIYPLDIKDWILYKIYLGTNCPNLWSESDKDFYIRRIYSTSYDLSNIRLN